MTVVEDRPAPPAAPPPRRSNPVLALLRNSWRQLTSMRTALVLLFLLAVAAIPGSVLPQRKVSPERVATYFRQHPDLAPVVDRLGGFDVYASAWFAAVYLLLFTSLIGCVLPRLVDQVRSLWTPPPSAPRRLGRLPQHMPGTPRPGAPAEVAADVAAVLRRRRFRTRAAVDDAGTWIVSAEKGYLKETGNLLFHVALLAVLVGVGFGSWYGWHGNRLLVQGADTGFCNAVTQYDESSLGPRVQPADLPRFCLNLTRFQATFQPTGQPKSFMATVDVTEDGGPVHRRRFTVNDPLRLHHANVHLLGQGYAPILRFTDRYGVSQTKVVPFLPTDGMLTSEGAAKFPDVNIDPATNKRNPDLQVGFEGVYLPTVSADGSPRSAYPQERSPALFLTAYRGDLGVDLGNPESVYALNRAQIASGQLTNVSGARPRKLTPGDTWTLDDGSTLQFLGTRPFVTLAVRYDPTQALVLGGAVAGLIGLMLSLAGHRRRVWFRISPPAPDADERGGSLVEAGGLPRTDYPGFGEEFAELVHAAVAAEAAADDGRAP
ncbi:cytochrome c biogenesis protein ResB [Mangrovihabitans endophyticus]|uniref:Cytochrome c biogenesis protein n=1 Tax=Mangrovihabitans endophyticus TaxID=1751298 RepID=A0A8J3C1T1_9ACTN|nr:cytochrome c biogenesis protein ResB [Mangrovihabitans endophyticus]GGK97293.1 cytochrome c biogenesis protein [Mangrovihabitans endophyticus]